MNTILHCRSDCKITAATQTNIIITTNSMFIITGYSQCPRTTKDKLPLAKETSFFVFAIYGRISRCICQIVFCSSLQFYKNPFTRLDIDSRSTTICKRYARKRKLELFITICLE